MIILADMSHDNFINIFDILKYIIYFVFRITLFTKFCNLIIGLPYTFVNGTTNTNILMLELSYNFFLILVLIKL